MKNLLLILALIALGYVAYQHYFKQLQQETKAPTKQEVKKPKDIPVPFEKKEVKQPSKKVIEQLQQFQKKKAGTIKQPQKKATKITEPKTKVVKPKPQLSRSIKTAVTRIRQCIANGRFFEAATLCKTVRIPKGMETEQKYFASLVAKVDRGLERSMQSKVSYLENKKRKAEVKYRQQLKKIKLRKSPRKAVGGDYAGERQKIIDRKYEKKKIAMKKSLTSKHNSYIQKIDTEIRSTKSKINHVRNSLK